MNLGVLSGRQWIKLRHSGFQVVWFPRFFQAARTTFRSFASRDFRVFMAGQIISLTGTAIQQTALGWLAYRLTGSPVFLGIVGFCGQIPVFFLSPFTGVLVDRYDRRNLIMMTQILSAVQAALLGILVMTCHIRAWQIPLLSLFLGIVNAVDIPARQALIAGVIGDRDHLGNALSLNSSAVNCARIAGPVAAGLLISAFGEAVCFWINAASYTAVIASLMAVKELAGIREKTDFSIWNGFRDGIRYVARTSRIRMVLFRVGFVSLSGVPFVVLLPVFVRDILAGDAHMLGFLTGSSGLGALCGALYLASMNHKEDPDRTAKAATFLFGISLIGFSRSACPMFSMVMLFFAGFGMMVQIAAGNAMLQTLVDDEKRGRVMGFYSMAFIGMIPFGSLWTGMLAARAGASMAIAVGGVGCILSAVLCSKKHPQ